MQKSILPQLHGVFVINKPKGMSSNQCISKLKQLGQKKIGHAGTLDPMARGVLIALLGEATKISSYLLGCGGKIYRGILTLGCTTDTWDAEGHVIEEHAWNMVDENAVEEAIREWVLIKEQEIPPYSAAKKDGQPFYKYARKGTFLKKTKSVVIEKAKLLSVNLPSVEFRVHCHSGTYIRSLAHSLGIRLQCGAMLSDLTREFSYPFGLEDAHELTEVLEDPGLLVRALLPIRSALPDWPCLEVPKAWINAVRSGQSIPASCFKEDIYKEAASKDFYAVLMSDVCEIALARLETPEHANPEWKIVRGLLN